MPETYSAPRILMNRLRQMMAAGGDAAAMGRGCGQAQPVAKGDQAKYPEGQFDKQCGENTGIGHAIRDQAHQPPGGEGEIDDQRRRDGRLAQRAAEDPGQHQRPQRGKPRRRRAQLAQKIDVIAESDAGAGIKALRRKQDHCADAKRGDTGQEEGEALKSGEGHCGSFR